MGYINVKAARLWTRKRNGPRVINALRYKICLCFLGTPESHLLVRDPFLSDSGQRTVLRR